MYSPQKGSFIARGRRQVRALFAVGGSSLAIFAGNSFGVADIHYLMVPGNEATYTGFTDISNQPGIQPDNIGSFDIVINPEPGLSGNPAALAAFNRAAVQWESYFADPVSINIKGDLLAFVNDDMAMTPNTMTIGSASSVILEADYDPVRSAMVADSAGEPDDGIVAFLPTLAQFTASVPAGFSLTDRLSANKANLKALGVTGLDVAFGANDATITFNTNFSFDYDNTDGVTPGQVDFETVAAHEIGHALGFTSSVDTIDFLTNDPDPGTMPGPISPRLLDLFRFEDGSADDPTTAAEFTTAERYLDPGGSAIFDEVLGTSIPGSEGALSTGSTNPPGDGRQASHWKDNGLSGTLIGVMDPTLASGVIVPITAADVRVLDLIGYDYIPEPTSLALLIAGAAIGLRRRRCL